MTKPPPLAVDAPFLFPRRKQKCSLTTLLLLEFSNVDCFFFFFFASLLKLSEPCVSLFFLAFFLSTPAAETGEAAVRREESEWRFFFRWVRKKRKKKKKKTEKRTAWKTTGEKRESREAENRVNFSRVFVCLSLPLSGALCPGQTRSPRKGGGARASRRNSERRRISAFFSLSFWPACLLSVCLSRSSLLLFFLSCFSCRKKRHLKCRGQGAGRASEIFLPRKAGCALA